MTPEPAVAVLGAVTVTVNDRPLFVVGYVVPPRNMLVGLVVDTSKLGPLELHTVASTVQSDVARSLNPVIGMVTDPPELIGYQPSGALALQYAYCG
jgi:hypothetical protein